MTPIQLLKKFKKTKKNWAGLPHFQIKNTETKFLLEQVTKRNKKEQKQKQ